MLGALLLTAMPLEAQAQKAKKEPKPKKEQAAPLTLDEICVELKNSRSTGDASLDNFVSGAVGMATSFKAMSDEWQNIKIVTTEIPDEGDGVTTAVTITDANGEPRTKESVVESNLNTTLNVTALALQATSMAANGTDLVSGIVSNPMRAISLAFGIKQMKLAINALTILSKEIPVFAENVKAQTELLKQAKSI